MRKQVQRKNRSMLYVKLLCAAICVIGVLLILPAGLAAAETTASYPKSPAEYTSLEEMNAAYFPETIDFDREAGVIARYHIDSPNQLERVYATTGLDPLSVAYVMLDEAFMYYGETSTFTTYTEGGYPAFKYTVALFWQSFSATDNIYSRIVYKTNMTTNIYTYNGAKEGRFFLQISVTDSTGNGLVFRASYSSARRSDLSNPLTVAGKVTQIISQNITGGMSDYAKAVALHDWLTNNANYDYTFTEYEADGVLLKGTGVCQSYALAYQMLLTEVGIPCLFVTGDAGGPHGWNMAKLGGDWYQIDVTWDDPGHGGYENHNYFGLTDAVLSTDHTWGFAEEGETYRSYMPACTATYYRYTYISSGVPLAQSIALSDTTLAMDAGEKQTLTATVSPNPCRARSLVWVSSNTAVAAVSDTGVVTAVSDGNAVITCSESNGGHPVQCAVTVGSVAPTPTPTPEIDTILIGHIAPITGVLASYGEAADNAVLMAVDEINAAGGILGKQLEVSTKDNQFSTDETVAAFNALASEGAVAIIGAVSSSRTMAITDLANSQEIPLMSPSATADTLTTQNDFVFRACYNDSYQGKLLAAFCASQDWAKVAILYATDDAYSSGLRNSFTSAAAAYGIDIVTEQTTQNTNASTDLTSQLTAINASGAQALFAPYYSDVAGSNIIPQARAKGFTGVILGADGYDGLETYASGDLSVYHHVYYANHFSALNPSTKVQTFVALYSQKYPNQTPNAISALAYDAAYMVAQAIRDAGTTDRSAIRAAMEGMTYSGVTGDMDMDATGTPIKPTVIITYLQANNALAQSYYKTQSENEEPIPDPGDANDDGAVDIMDLVAIVNYIVNSTAPSSMTGADANGDGTVDIMDLVWIINYIVNPPVGAANTANTVSVEVPFYSASPIAALEIQYTLSPGLSFVSAECAGMVGAGGTTNAVFASVNAGVTSGTVTLKVALNDGVTANQSLSVTALTGANTSGKRSVGAPQSYAIEVDASEPITIVTQPVDTTVIEGNAAEFTVAATGDGTLTYQWYLNTNTGLGWLAIAGATETAYNTGAVTLADDGFRYFCRITSTTAALEGRDAAASGEGGRQLYLATGDTETSIDSAVATLTVEALPQTGDGSHPGWLIALAALAGCGIVALLLRRRIKAGKSI